jgi:hypothetical protein
MDKIRCRLRRPRAARRSFRLNQGIRRVVVFRALQVGDMLCAVPALRALRVALPQAHIALVGLPWAAQFAHRFGHYLDAFHAFPGHPLFPEQPFRAEEDEAFRQAMRAEHFDLAIQLHGSGEVSNGIVLQWGARHCAGYAAQASGEQGEAQSWFSYPQQGPEPVRLLSLVNLLGASEKEDHLEFPLHPPDWAELQRSGLAAGLAPGSYVCVHPGARFRDKCWPPERFAQVADTLCEEFNLRVVLTGSAKEAERTRAVASRMRMPAIDTASPLSIGAMAALMSGARLLICNDTGVSHIAAGLQLKSVVIFNQADMARWAPLDRRLHRCVHDPGGERVDDVLQQARQLLTGPGYCG